MYSRCRISAHFSEKRVTQFPKIAAVTARLQAFPLLIPSPECSAYSSVVEAFRAGGPLTEEKQAALLQLGKLLGIGVERHRAEVRKAGSDERLSTVSLQLSGGDPSSTWLREGRRIIPLLPRARPLTALASLADRASGDLRQHNSTLPPPENTFSAPPPPSLARPSPTPPPPPEQPEFALPQPLVCQNGVSKKNDDDGENGFVVLPSGMAVRLRDGSPPSGRRGKRKRGKSIEIFPDGVPLPKTASVLGAGHGYARQAPLPDTPSKRGPNASQQLLPNIPGSPSSQARGRPRLLSPGPQPRGPRARAPRPAMLISPRPPPPNMVATMPPLLISQTSAVQVAIPPPAPPRLTMRPPGPPRATTIQLKQEMGLNPTQGSLQGLKVISHSTTKMLAKPGASAVYMLPSAPRMSLGPHRLLAVSSASPRLLSPGLGFPTGVIRTVRARQPSGTPGAKPSVIVVQKSSVPGGIRTTRPATVALYRPARALGPGTQGPRFQAPGEGANNVILLDLQEQTSQALSSLLSASGMLPEASDTNGTQRKIYLQRPATTTVASSVWLETQSTPQDLSTPSLAEMPPTSCSPSAGRMVTLPHRPVLSTTEPEAAASPPGLEVRPGRENGET